MIAGISLTLPLVATALDYSDAADRYEDAAQLSMAERAAVNVLTNEGIVEGEGGLVSPGRPVNRAEISKVILLAAYKDAAEVETVEGVDCFPDVREKHWFAKYVCSLHDREVVQGNPDGLFHPERTLNLAEAVTMAVRMWDLALPVYIREPDHWYDPYMDAARGAGILTSDMGNPAMAMSRGKTFRLIAAFKAYADGELDMYRRAERGEDIAVSSSSSSTSSTPSMPSSSSISSLSSSSSHPSSKPLPDFPAVGRLLLAGTRTQPVATARFFANLEPVRLRAVKVTLMAEAESIQSLYLVDASGTQITQLSLDPYDTTDKTWRATIGTSPGYEIPHRENKFLGVEVVMKGDQMGAVSEEMIQVDEFSLTVEGIWTGETFGSQAQDSQTIAYPKHQTVRGKITGVKSAGPAEDIFIPGSNHQLASFAFSGVTVSTGSPRIEHLQFQVSAPSTVSFTNWVLSSPTAATTHACSVDSISSLIINCLSIPSDLGTIGSAPRVLRISADTSLSSGAAQPTVQVSLNQPGSIDATGAVRWTDGSGHFNWIEALAPIARGTAWR